MLVKYSSGPNFEQHVYSTILRFILQQWKSGIRATRSKFWVVQPRPPARSLYHAPDQNCMWHAIFFSLWGGLTPPPTSKVAVPLNTKLSECMLWTRSHETDLYDENTWRRCLTTFSRLQCLVSVALGIKLTASSVGKVVQPWLDWLYRVLRLWKCDTFLWITLACPVACKWLSWHVSHSWPSNTLTLPKHYYIHSNGNKETKT